jgi:hypothetical protein
MVLTLSVSVTLLLPNKRVVLTCLPNFSDYCKKAEQEIYMVAEGLTFRKISHSQSHGQHQGCQIFFLVQSYQDGKNVPNGKKLYQTPINYKKFQMVIK